MIGKIVRCVVKSALYLFAFAFGAILTVIALFGHSGTSHHLSTQLFKHGVSWFNEKHGSGAVSGEFYEVQPFQWVIERGKYKGISFQRLSLEISPLYLLIGRLHISNLDVEGMFAEEIFAESSAPIKDSSLLRASPIDKIPLLIDCTIECFHLNLSEEMRELLKGKGIESSDLYGSLALSGHRRQLSFALSAAQKCENNSSTHMSGELYILPESILGEFTLQENTGGGLNRLLGLKSAIPLEGYIKAQIFFDPVLHVAFFVDIPHYRDEKSILEMDRLHIRGYCLLESAARCIVEDLSVTVLTPNVRSQVRASFEVSQDGVVEQGHAITHTKINPSTVTASAIKTELSFWGPLSSLKFENETSTADLSIAGVKVENFSIHSQGSYEESVFKVDYIFDGRIDGQPLHSIARMSWDKENCLSIDDIAFSLGKMDLQGQLKLDCVDFGINGQLSMDGFHLDELPLISANELIPKGKGHLLVTFEKVDSEHKQNGHFRFNLNQLKSQGISAETVSYIFNIEDLFGTPYFSTCLMLRDVDLGEVFLEEIILEGAGNDRTMIPLRAYLRGRQSGHSFQGGARFDLSLDSHSCALQMLDLELFGEMFALAEPTKIEFSKNSLFFHPLLLKGNQSSFELSGQVSAQKVDLKVTAVTLSVNVLKGCFEGLDKRLIQGEFGFQAHLFGELSSPEIELKLALSDWVVSSGGVWFSQPLSGFWNMELRANSCHFHSQIEQQGSAPLTVEGVLPLSFSIRPMVFTLDKLMPWECRIRGESEAAALLKMFYGSKIPLTGQVEIEVDITGTPQDPVVTGGFLLKNGTYEILEIGSVFKGVEAQLTLKDRQLQLLRLRASDGVQGNLTAEGFIRLDEEAAPLAIDLKLDRWRMLQQDYIEVTSSGNLRLAGSLDEPILEGKLNVDHVIVTPQAKKNSVTINPVPVKFVNPSAAVEKGYKPSKSKPSRFQLNFDIGIDIPTGKMTVETKELASEWLGYITLKGNTSKPLLYGNIRCQRGDFRLRGKSFWIEQGSLNFEGDLDKKATLFVVASHEIDRLTIQLVLKGRIKKPMPAFRSNPPLPQKEILSRLLFNSSSGDYTSIEEGMSQDPFMLLPDGSDEEDTLDLFSRLQKFGIDRFEFENQSDEYRSNLSVNIGKYLSRGVYVSLNRGLSRDTNRICVEAKVIPHVKIRAEVDDEKAGRMLLMWRRDY